MLSMNRGDACGKKTRFSVHVGVKSVLGHFFFTHSHHGDAEDVCRSAAVAHSLTHPTELSRHVAEPVDCFIGVALNDRQDLIVLLFGHIQQLGNLVQLHVQLPNTGALWR